MLSDVEETEVDIYGGAQPASIQDLLAFGTRGSGPGDIYGRNPGEFTIPNDISGGMGSLGSSWRERYRQRKQARKQRGKARLQRFRTKLRARRGAAGGATVGAMFFGPIGAAIGAAIGRRRDRRRRQRAERAARERVTRLGAGQNVVQALQGELGFIDVALSAAEDTARPARQRRGRSAGGQGRNRPVRGRSRPRRPQRTQGQRSQRQLRSRTAAFAPAPAPALLTRRESQQATAARPPQEAALETPTQAEPEAESGGKLQAFRGWLWPADAPIYKRPAVWVAGIVGVVVLYASHERA